MTMTLTIPRRLTKEVADLAEASALYAAERDASGEGVSTFPEGKVALYGDTIGYVSYNGKIWAKSSRYWTTGDKPLFDPSEQVAA